MERESVAKILILNEQNQILILRTGEYKEHPEKEHQPDLPGGLVDPNESEHQAVVRETMEEAGIALDPNAVTLGYTETKFYADEGKSVTKLLYLVRLAITPEVTISWEHEAYEWVNVATLLETHPLRSFYTTAVRYLQNNQLL